MSPEEHYEYEMYLDSLRDIVYRLPDEDEALEESEAHLRQDDE